ncbi:hypothetical protein B0A48_10940 [Cryoendolithus antarcticus]|uniref:AB hydrolase-1 domain-containing protein n=1 Tax=Cryoendolithus antarcticus TaxID=1507870 RepID=A0A1V8SZ24_9PEZI|nr:hypothetical protein B0A48_10940 [Cryoendolithus antarcticus]
MPFVATSSLNVHYQISGEEHYPWLVLINGLADDVSTWDPQVPAFAEAGYRVLTYDNRGIGRTTSLPDAKDPKPYTSELLANDLHELLNLLKIDKYHLLGISMGGMIAQSFALAYPNDSTEGSEILSLSLCCTYAAPSLFCSRMFALWADMAQRMSIRDVMKDVTLWAFTVPFFLNRPAEVKEVDEAMDGLQMPLEEYLAQLNVIQTFDSTAALAKLAAEGKGLANLPPSKVMVLAGVEDILIPVLLSSQLERAIPDCRWWTTRGGHACSLEFSEEFNASVLQFLNSLQHRRKIVAKQQ